MKSSRTRIALLALLCGTSFVKADILMLKNGTKVEGSIIEQNAQGVRMKYRLTPKIMDDKVFPMAEIAQVIKQRPEEVEVVDLRKLLPTADLLKADQYEQIIQDRLRPFVNKYASTPEAKEVEGIIEKLQEEKTLVTNGQVKLEGRWLSVKESKGESFSIEAFRILSEMREKAAAREYVEALRAFDKFFAVAPGFVGTNYYVEAIPEAMAILDKWSAILDKLSTEFTQLDTARRAGLEKLKEPELSKTKKAIEDEFFKWRAMADVMRNQRVRWVAPYKYDLQSIQTAQKEAISERSRLEMYNLQELKAQNAVFMACYRKIGEGDYTGGAAAYERAATLSVKNEFRDVPNDLRTRLMNLYGQLVRGSATAASTTSGSSAIGGMQATQQDARVAAILAEASGGAAATGKPAAATTPAQIPATAAPAAVTPAAAVPVPAAAAPAVAPQPQLFCQTG
ncbi:MAG: hypothetical protein NTV80_01380 [Verrucomicrobia bacterium]|nr:hypothetical protein [Verrucomicrobiota bacterium]